MEGEQQKGCRQLTFSIHPYDFRFHILRRLLPEDLFVLLVRRVDRKPSLACLVWHRNGKMLVSRRQTITVTQKYLSGIRGRNEMVKNVTVIS